MKQRRFSRATARQRHSGGVSPHRIHDARRARRFERLEDRLLLHGGTDHDHWDGPEVHYDEVHIGDLHVDDTAAPADAVSPASTASIVALNPLSSLPNLNSNTGASASLYLDFNGHFESTWGAYSNVNTPVFDQDGDASTFSDSELATITEIWRRVAEDFAPLHLNVTTVDPGDFSNGVALRASIGGDGSWIGPYGGVAYVNSFTNSIVNTVYVFSDNLGNGFAKYVAEATSHEAGHGFGLQHQSEYNGSILVEEYYAGDGDRAPIMGNSYATAQSVWYYGTSTTSTTFQDDLAVLSRAANGFGYRADDHGNTIATATALTVVNGSLSGSGIITTTSDADYFSFTSGAGTISLTVNGAVGANLDVLAELRTASGTLVTSANPGTSLNATVAANVAAGNYVLVVRSAGAYGEVGQYTVSGTATGGSFPGGLYRNGQWFLDGDGLGGVAEQSVHFGINGDAPVVGDWNGDGVDDVGIVRGNRWYFDLDGAGGAGESSALFGLASDVPVVGDWNGDGTDDIGVFRNGVWFLDAVGNDGIAETSFIFGIGSDTPIVGDWNGDGTDDVGVFRNGAWFFDLDGAGAAAEQAVYFGLGSDVPVVGDWNADGTDNVGIFRNGWWHMDTNGAGGAAELSLMFGVGSDTPVTGIWFGAAPSTPSASTSIASLAGTAALSGDLALGAAISEAASPASQSATDHLLELLGAPETDAAHGTLDQPVSDNPLGHLESQQEGLPVMTDGAQLKPIATMHHMFDEFASTNDEALGELLDLLDDLLVESHV